MDRAKRLGKWIAHHLWMTSAILVIVIAVLVSIIRTLLPYLSEYKTDLELRLSEQLGFPVLISSIDAKWNPLGPELIIKELEIRDPSAKLSVISLRTATVKINAWRSLINLSPYATLIDLEGIVVNLQKQADHSLTLVAATIDKRSEESPQTDEELDFSNLFNTLLDHLLAQSKISIINSRITIKDDDLKSGLSTIKLQDIQVTNKNEEHQIVAEVSIAAVGVIDVVAEFNGDPRDRETKTEIYAKTEQLNLAKLPVIETHPRNKMQSAFFNSELWLERSKGYWQSGFAKLSLDDIQYKEKGKQHLPIDRISMSVELKKLEGLNWWLQSYDMSLNIDDIDVVDASWLTKIHQSGNESLEIQSTLQDLTLKKLIEIASRNPYVEDTIKKALNDMQIQGDVRRLTYNYNVGQTGRSAASLQLENFSMKPWQGLPGMSNMAGTLSYAHGLGGAFELDSASAELTFPDLFRKPLTLESLAVGGVFYTKQDSAFVDINSLQLNNTDLDLSARGRLRFTEGQSGFMSLLATINRLDLKALPNYLPTGIMGKGLTSFLDTAFKEGELNQLKLVSHGDFAQFPYKASGGYFGVGANIDNLTMKYLPDWPAVSEAKTQLMFVKDELDVLIESGKLDKISVKNVKAKIPTMDANDSKVIVTANINTPYDTAKSFIKKSPLKDGLGQALDDLRLKRNLELEIMLDAGFDADDPFILDGKAIFKDQELVYLPMNISAKSLRGEVQFSDKSITSTELKTKIYDYPSSIHVKGDSTKNEGMHIVIDINSRLTPLQLKKQFGGPWEKFITGSINYDVNIGIKTKAVESQRVVTRIYSDLDGAEIYLPGDYYKKEQEKKPLSMEVRRVGNKLILIADYDKVIKSLVVLKEENQKTSFHGANIVIGKQKPKRVVKPGLNIRGEIEQLNLDTWLAYLDTLNLGDDEQDEPAKLVVDLDVVIAALDAFGLPIENIRVLLNQAINDNLAINLANANIDGSVNVLTNQEKTSIVANFDKLIINEIPEQQEQSKQVSPFDLPPLLVKCKYCEVMGKALGRVSFSGRPIDYGYEFDSSIALLPLIELNANGTWILENNINMTAIKGTVRSTNIGALFDKWQIRGGIRDSGVTGKFNFFWPDSPSEVDVAMLGGNLSIELDQGFIEQVSDAKARLFSLMSLSSIRRRLSLDFSDLFSQGFFYDRIVGEFYLENGWARTDSAKVFGPAADVEISGASDLVEQKYEQRVLVRPKIVSTLPVLAGYAIQPQVGVAMLIFNEVFEPFDVITSLEYEISGPWEEPEVTEVGKTVRKISAEEIQKNKEEKENP